MTRPSAYCSSFWLGSGMISVCTFVRVMGTPDFCELANQAMARSVVSCTSTSCSRGTDVRLTGNRTTRISSSHPQSDEFFAQRHLCGRVLGQLGCASYILCLERRSRAVYSLKRTPIRGQEKRERVINDEQKTRRRCDDLLLPLCPGKSVGLITTRLGEQPA